MARQLLNTSCRAKSNTALTGSLTRFARPIAISAFTAAAAMLTSVALTGRSAAQTWGPGAGNWGDSFNWTPTTIPNAIDATATFNAIPSFSYGVALTGGPFTVGTLNLDSSIGNGGYNFQAGTLIMHVSSGSAAINVQSRNFQADFGNAATLQLNSNTVITTASSAAHLTVDGLVTGFGALTIAVPVLLF